MLRRAAGLLTPGLPPRRLPGSCDPVASWRKSRLPLQRRDRPGLAPEFPHSLAGMWRESEHRLPWPAASAIAALDLDGVLADTRPLWAAWHEDAARRARVELDVPADREAAAALLDEALGDWRPLLTRFAADRAPLSIRPRPDNERRAAATEGGGCADRRLQRRSARAGRARPRARGRGAAGGSRGHTARGRGGSRRRDGRGAVAGGAGRGPTTMKGWSTTSPTAAST